MSENIKETDENPVRNKGGRPKGSRPKSKGPALLDKLISSNKNQIKEILQTAIDLAHNGEPWAVQAVLDRTWPKPAARVTFAMPRLSSAADCAACLDALLQAAAAGAISPAECNQLSAVVAKTGEALLAKGIEERLAALESAGKPQELTYRRLG